MDRRRFHSLIAAIATAGMAVPLALYSGCGPTNSGTSNATGTGGADPTTITIDGSSTVYPVTEAVAEDFQDERQGKIRVSVGISGTGGGFKKFSRGEIDISEASRPILKKEMEDAAKAGIEYIELPVCFDALTVAVNKENDWLESITVAELKQIWEPEAQEKITHWNQVRSEWPQEKIQLFGAGSDSGTFDYFTEAVVGKAKSSRGDYTASEDDNVLVQGISGNKFALGYLPFAYYEENKDKLKALAVDWEKDQEEAVLPSLENVLAGKYNPLSRPLFLYIKKSAAERDEVKQFVDYYLENVTELAKEVHYLPLPAGAYDLARQRFSKGETGTAFGGVPEVGVKVEEILTRELKK